MVKASRRLPYSASPSPDSVGRKTVPAVKSVNDVCVNLTTSDVLSVSAAVTVVSRDTSVVNEHEWAGRAVRSAKVEFPKMCRAAPLHRRPMMHP